MCVIYIITCIHKRSISHYLFMILFFSITFLGFLKCATGSGKTCHFLSFTLRFFVTFLSAFSWQSMYLLCSMWIPFIVPFVMVPSSVFTLCYDSGKTHILPSPLIYIARCSLRAMTLARHIPFHPLLIYIAILCNHSFLLLPCPFTDGCGLAGVHAGWEGCL